MARIACRWPGGMTLAIPRDGAVPLTATLDGPSSIPPVLSSVVSRPPVSRESAAQTQQRVRDAMDHMRSTADDELTQRDYGATEISGAFWAEWLSLNAENEVVTSRLVFEL